MKHKKDRRKSLLMVLALLIISAGTSFTQMPQLTMQTGHTDEIKALAFSNDGKYLASAGKDNVIIIWDFILGKQIKRLKVPSGSINCLKFFHDEYKLVTAGSGNNIYVWDLKSETIIRTLSLDDSVQVNSLDISPDNILMAFSGNFRHARIWTFNENVWKDCIPRNHISRLNDIYHSDISQLTSVEFVSGGQELAICRSGGIYFCNLLDFSVNRNIKSKRGRKINLMIVDKSGENLFFSHNRIKKMPQPRISKWDLILNRQEYIRPSDFMKYQFTAVSINADQSIIAAGNEDNTIYLWDFPSGNKYHNLSGHKNAISTLLYHPEKKNILVSCDKDRVIYVWDISKREIIKKMGSATYPITMMAVNKAGNRISLAGTDNSIKIFELKNIVDVQSLKGHSSNVCGLDFLQSDDTLISVGLDNKIHYWNLSNNQLYGSMSGNTNTALINTALHLPLIATFANTFTSFFYTKTFLMHNLETLNTMDITGNSRYLAVGGRGFRSGYYYNLLAPRIFPIHLIDIQSQRKNYKFRAHYLSINSLSFNSGGNILASCGKDYKMGSKTLLEFLLHEKENMGFNLNYNEINSLKIWDIEQKKLVGTYENQSPINALAFNTINDSLLFVDDDGDIVLFDFNTNISQNLSSGFAPVFFNPDGTSFFFQDNNYSMKLYDLEENRVIKEFHGHTDKITSAALFPDGKRLATAGWDGTLKLWDVENAELIVTFYTLNENDFLIKTPDNYYFATKNAVSEFGFTSGMKFYSFDQFDLKYNRPDIVLSRLGNIPEELLNAYQAAYKKRLNKMGFTEEMLSEEFYVPEVYITNQESFEPVVFNDKITLNIRSVDTRYKLDRLNVWINDVALYGKNGIDLRPLDNHEAEQELEILLARGNNKIQVSTMNQRGAESLRETIEIEYESETEKPDLYLFTVGVSEYRDTRFNLDYASKDAGDMANLFKEKYSLFNNIFIKTLSNEQVTRENLKEIRDLFERAGRNDVVMLFIAGHGMLDENLDYYFATYDMDFDNPSAKGIIYEDIESLLDGLLALKKILVMDTCHSGEVEIEETKLVSIQETEYGQVIFRNAGIGVRKKEAFGLSNTTEIMKELFTDLRRGTGSTVISSAGGTEFAMEGDLWKNGLFTFCLLNGLNNMEADLNEDDRIMLSELQKYTRESVRKLSNGKQVPTSRIQNISMDFQIW